jgi:hypothetical protein
MYINIFSFDGPKISFQKENYIKEIEEMQNISRLELVASLRRFVFITSYSCQALHLCLQLSGRNMQEEQWLF